MALMKPTALITALIACALLSACNDEQNQNSQPTDNDTSTADTSPDTQTTDTQTTTDTSITDTQTTDTQATDTQTTNDPDTHQTDAADADDTATTPDTQNPTDTTADTGNGATPTITLQGDNPLRLVANENYAEPGFTAQDAEDGDLTSAVVVTGTAEPIAGNYTLTYTVTDSDGNEASTARIVNVVPATIACTLRSNGGLCDAMMPEVWGGELYELKNINAPGMTYCVRPNAAAKGMSIENVTGAEGQPVTIINCDGQVTLNTSGWQNGISVINSRYIHLTGTGSADHFYGIVVNQPGGPGLDATNGTSDFEVDHIHIESAGGSGIVARTYPFIGSTCHPEWTRPNFTQYNTSIHDNYVNGTNYEGFYIGTSHYGSEPTCGGTVMPQASLIGVKVYNNILKDTGNDGIQIGGAISGVEVYNNRIEGYARHNNEQHAGGLQLNGGTGGVYYNNLIEAHPDADTAQSVMYIGSTDAVYIYNNVFVGGNKALMTLNRMDNATHLYFTHNTYYGSGVGDTFYFFCNANPSVQPYTIEDNIFTEYGTIGSNDGGTWNYFNGRDGNKCPINGAVMTGNGANEEALHMSGNYFSKSAAGILFTNPAADDYTVAPSSPAFGMGADLSVIIPQPDAP